MPTGVDGLRLRRVGRYSVVDLEGLASSTVSSRVETLGVGLYQWLVVTCVGGVSLCESLEMGAVAPLHAAISRVFELSDSVRASLPLFTYGGSMLGLIVGGPMGDTWGRKITLVISLLCITLSMVLTALLPPGTHSWIILTLRFLSGFAGAIGGPAGLTLAVESCPESVRAKVMFAVMFLGSLGYLLEAFAVQLFMPDFGEAETDQWRVFCLVITAPAVLSLPLTFILSESPCFLAVNGNAEACMKVLNSIASWNAIPPVQQSIRVPQMQASMRADNGAWGTLFVSFAQTFWSYPGMLALLTIIESSRAFFMSGSSYLWKDLFNMPYVEEKVSPASLNVVTSVSPLIGLMVGTQIVNRLGVRCTCTTCAVVAAASLILLTVTSIRAIPAMLVILILFTKLTYGPLGTCICLMKLEAFPTEVRTTTYAFISMVGKLLCLLAPTLVEVLRGGDESSDWTNKNLVGFIWSLTATSMLCGIFSLLVPRSSDVRKPLEDYVEQPRDEEHEKLNLPLGMKPSRQNSAYGSFYNIWTPVATPTATSPTASKANDRFTFGEATNPQGSD